MDEEGRGSDCNGAAAVRGHRITGNTAGREHTALRPAASCAFLISFSLKPHFCYVGSTTATKSCEPDLNKNENLLPNVLDKQGGGHIKCVMETFKVHACALLLSYRSCSSSRVC